MKPDTLVEDGGPPNSQRNSENYLHWFGRGIIATSGCRKSVYICKRDIISTKPDTLDGDRGPSNLQRSSKNCLLRFNFDATSTSAYNLEMRERLDAKYLKNNFLRRERLPSIKRRGRVSRQVYFQPSVRQLYEWCDPSSIREGTQDQPFA